MLIRRRYLWRLKAGHGKVRRLASAAPEEEFEEPRGAGGDRGDDGREPKQASDGTVPSIGVVDERAAALGSGAAEQQQDACDQDSPRVSLEVVSRARGPSALEMDL